MKAAGKLIVGTSADYPPYEFYNSQYAVDGLDPALATELGKRIGVHVELSDFALEGLLSALQLGQVDAVIAALTPNSQRRQQVDFTNEYFIGASAVLAPKDSPVTTLSSLSQLAGKRVGAERGSTYDTVLKNQLVAKGLSKATDIFEYLNTADAIKDLQDKKIDFFLLDRLSAEAFAKSDNFKVIGEGTRPQRFAIAVRKGSNLRTALNDALLAAQNDGTVQKLITQYLKLQPNQIEPVTPATPEPTATAGSVVTATLPVCIDGMTYVADLSFNDQNMTAPPSVQSGSGFTKSWRFQNSGNCAWAADYSLRFVFGNITGANMGGRAVSVGRSVVSGQTIDLSVNLIAPSAAGTYQGFWQMYNTSGIPFGVRVWVGINVLGPPTATPPPPTAVVTPNGVVNYFTADQAIINLGQGVNFRWDTANANAVYFYQEGQDYNCCGRPGTSVETVYPQTSGVWDLRVVDNNGGVTVRQIYMTVIGSLTPTLSLEPWIEHSFRALQKIETAAQLGYDKPN